MAIGHSTPLECKALIIPPDSLLRVGGGLTTTLNWPPSKQFPPKCGKKPHHHAQLAAVEAIPSFVWERVDILAHSPSPLR